MTPDFEALLKRYADLAVRVGVNLRPGQRLFIGSSVPFELAPLARACALSAYQAGARLVEVLWHDDALTRLRFEHAPRDSFDDVPAWRGSAPLEFAQNGDALLFILAEDPDLLRDQDPALVGTLMRATALKRQALSQIISSNGTNWCVIGAAVPSMAARVYEDLPPEARQAALWQAIFDMCRLDQADPLAAWRAHVEGLIARGQSLTRQGYAALHFRAPGTDLRVGLPAGHKWVGGSETSQHGIRFVANLPTEEVFTVPHRLQVEGEVTASMPLNFKGMTLDGIRLRFEGGRVVQASAHQGEGALRQLLETDASAGRLGEVALVPSSSPVARQGRLFYNGLLDENAACHLALGRAYRHCLEGGQQLAEADFVAAGGNVSALHVDFMIGSPEMDVDGLTTDGRAEPIMRAGEWALAG